MKILTVAGARPNFMKIAPLMDAFRSVPSIDPILVHTGQHYDARMSELFFRQLGIPEPDVDLAVGSASHAVQTAEIMKAFEPVLGKYAPDAVLVVGDVNSTIACGLVAAKLGIKLIHVEAGLRSFDRSMPEEINRVLTDSISDILFCSEQSGVDNLLNEGISPAKIHFVGNVMIDTLMRNKAKAEDSQILTELGLRPSQYAVLTLHRPGNVDDERVLATLLDALEVIQRELPIVFPVHPRTRKALAGAASQQRIAGMKGLRLIEPAGYLDFLRLMSSAKLVLTDSGGIQEETTILRVPCLTLRDNTERPVTVELGSNRIVGTDPDNIVTAFRECLDAPPGDCAVPPLWDGQAAPRIARILADELSSMAEQLPSSNHRRASANISA